MKQSARKKVQKKSALHKDFFIEIKKTLNRFLSILLIVALGVAFFAGLRVCRSDMELTADTYYDDQNLMDLRVISTLGLTNEDITALSDVDGVKTVEGAFTKDVLLKLSDAEIVVKTYSMNDSVNQRYLVEGRIPVALNECIVDSLFLDNTGYKIGDTIQMVSGDDTLLSETFEELTLTIVGSCADPRYLTFSRGNGSIGNGKINSFIVLPKDNYKSEIFQEAYVTVTGAKESLTYSSEYENLVTNIKKDIENIAKKQLDIRYEVVVEQPLKDINEGKEELDKAKNTLEEEKLKALEAFDAASNQINAMENTIQAARIELDNKRAQLYAINYGENDVNQLLGASESELSANEEEIEKQKSELQNQIDLANKDFDTARDELTKKEEELKDAELTLLSLSDPEWFVLDRNTIESYVSFGSDAERMQAIAEVFPVIFFLVAALVCLTTMTRMVDEQRVQIGTLKALGYSKVSIASKYILYALLATVTGSIIGVLIGQKVFPAIVIQAYKIMYQNLPYALYPYRIGNALVAGGIAVACTTLATYLACYKELKSGPAKLMRPVAPKVGKRILLERITFIWSRLNFTKKSTLRNLFRYKKRLFMTVVGIAGCMALMLVGFGIKDSIGVMANEQYKELWLHDATVTLKTDLSTEEKNKFIDNISQDAAVIDATLAYESIVELSNEQITKTSNMVVLESEEEFRSFYHFRDRVSKEKYDITKDGVILTEKLAKELGVLAGDFITLKIDEFQSVQVKVTAITENYIGYYFYLLPELYENLYGEEVIYNQSFIRHIITNSEEEEKLFSKLIDENTSILSISSIHVLQQRIDDMLESLNIVVYVLIICAGLLAFIVLYNLSNININERKRELASLKVLGFYDNEVNSYVMRETLLLTLIGILGGIALGVVLHRFVIITCEVEGMMFGRLIKGVSYLMSAVLTLVFSGIISIVMYFKLRKINMIESLKSVE